MFGKRLFSGNTCLTYEEMCKYLSSSEDDQIGSLDLTASHLDSNCSRCTANRDKYWKQKKKKVASK